MNSSFFINNVPGLATTSVFCRPGLGAAVLGAVLVHVPFFAARRASFLSILNHVQWFSPLIAEPCAPPVYDGFLRSFPRLLFGFSSVRLSWESVLVDRPSRLAFSCIGSFFSSPALREVWPRRFSLVEAADQPGLPAARALG